MKQYNSETYLSHLWEMGQTEFDQLTDFDLASMSSHLIAEMPLSLLPPIEQKDHSRELFCLIGKWIDTEDQDLGQEILEKLRHLTIEAMKSGIERKLMDYAKRELAAQKEAKRCQQEHVWTDNKQRI